MMLLSLQGKLDDAQDQLLVRNKEMAEVQAEVTMLPHSIKLALHCCKGFAALMAEGQSKAANCTGGLES